MEYNYCYVLDYSTGTIHELCINCMNKKVEEFETEDDIIRYWGFHPSNCSWMFSDEKIELNIIVKPEKEC